MSGSLAYEPSDAAPGTVAAMAVSLAAGVALSLVVSAWCYHGGPKAGAPPLGPAGAFMQGPAQRTGIERDWEAIDRETRDRLHSYGWIDRSRGVVRIPIERAMELVEAEGRAPAAKGKP